MSRPDNMAMEIVTFQNKACPPTKIKLAKMSNGKVLKKDDWHAHAKMVKR